MKKLIFILLLFVQIISFGQYRTVLSESQTFIVPSDASNNEWVGTIRSYPEVELLGTSINYSLKTNFQNIYSVADSGTIVIANDINLNIGLDSIEVTITKGAITNDIWFYIRSVDFNNVTFIDFDGTSGAGTRASPLNNFETFHTGDTILCKRGSSISRTQLFISGISNMLIGSYGSGAKPIVSCTSNGGRAITITDNSDNITLRELDVKGEDYILDAGGSTTVSNGIYVTTNSDNAKILYCDIHRFGGGVSMYNGYITDFSWNEVYNIANDGVFFANAASMSTISILANANYVHDVNDNDQIYDNESQANGDGFQSDHIVTYSNNFVDRTSSDFKFAIIAGSVGCNFINNYFNMGTVYHRPAVYPITSGHYFKGNYFKNGAFGVYNSSGNQTFEYNIFDGCDDVGIFGAGATHNVYNNVFYNCNAALNTGTYTAKNNVLLNVTGLGTGTTTWTYNVYYGTTPEISGATNYNYNPAFINSTLGDFRVLSTSPIVDIGTDVSLTVDYFNNTVPYNTIPDIGVFEYQGIETPIDNTKYYFKVRRNGSYFFRYNN